MPRFLAFVLFSTFPSFLGALEIVAHRGASYDAPENTLAAFKLAWEQKADAIEVDVYLTKDGQIIVLHDKDTLRTTGVKYLPAEKTLAELRALDAGAWKAPQWKDERLPTLAEVLATLPEHGRIFIEIKCGAEILPELRRVITASGKKNEQISIIDFTFDTLVKARPLFPGIELLFLHGGTHDKKTGVRHYPDIEELAGKAQQAGLDGLDLSRTFPITAEAVAKVKARGLKFAVWTVNLPEDAIRLTAAGVDAITTDRPAFLREALASATSDALPLRERPRKIKHIALDMDGTSAKAARS